MFTPASLEKSPFINVENSLSGRSNVSSRYPVGVSSLGDENQQIRIQLAVHKYNSSPNPPKNNRRSLTTPTRPYILKNSLKSRGYEENGDSKVKTDKNKNPYDEVGAFPTVHLKKNSVLYRPIRRFGEVKVPYPDLPVNRFLSHLPEFSPHLKNNTRSVLEVLQDLSRKKIQPKEEEELCNQPRSKGLGGDFGAGVDGVYRPLFVPKPKIVNIVTKDNTTQTLSSHCSTSSSSINSATGSTSLGDPDPKAELRRKLARQNNEIFASLSSSIASSFPTKRKREKVPPSKDNECLNDVTVVKKAKILEHRTNNTEENGVSNFVGIGQSNDQLIKTSRKLCESNSKSPNKDRLTTIYLDMQNTSPKSQVFRNGTESSETNAKPGSPPSEEATEPNGFVNTAKEQSPDSSAPVNADENSFKKAVNVVSDGSFTSEKLKNQPENSPSFSTGSVFKSDSAESKGDPKPGAYPLISFGTKSSADEKIASNDANKNSAASVIPVNKTQKGTGSSESKIEAFPATGSKDVNPFTSSFKFDAKEKCDSSREKPFVINSVGSKPQPAEETSKSNSTVGTPVTDSGASNPPFSKTSEPSTTQVVGQENISSSKNDVQTAVFNTPKPLYTFGIQNSTFSNLGNPNKSEEKSVPGKIEAKIPIGASSGSLGQRSQTLFTFEPKSEELKNPKTDNKADGGKTDGISSGQSFVSQPNVLFPITSAGSFQPAVSSETRQDQNGAATTTSSTAGPVFTFGQKVTTPETSSSVSATTSQPAFSFAFGQKSESPAAKLPETNLFGQKSSTNLFSFGKKASSPEARPNTAESTEGFAQQNLFKRNSASLSESSVKPIANQPLLFGKGVSSGQGTNTVQSPNLATANFSAPAFSQSNSLFPGKTNAFGTPATSQSVSGFGTSLPSNGFGAPASSQSDAPFGGAQSTPAFGIPNSTQALGFGQTQGSIFTQANNTFGNSATTPSSTGFGNPTTTQSTPFGFTAAGPSQSSAPFGGPPSTQPPTMFGGNSAPQNSFSQLFGQNGNKSNALGQTQSIFGQPPASSAGFASPSGNAFTSSQNSIFGQKVDSSPASGFPQNKIQMPSFGQNLTAPPFGTPGKFSFGMSSPAPTEFTASQPSTTTAPVFNFGASAPGQPAFGFGGSSASSAPGNPPAPFAFKSPGTEAFKFGASPAKEGSGFGGGNAMPFGFGAQSNNNMAEAKPGFNFGTAQVTSSAPGFNFNSTPSASVFSFGSSSSSSTGSGFNFGAPQAGGPFGQPSTSSPSSFSAPGTFSIGWGSSQTKPRAASRLRRRP